MEPMRAVLMVGLSAIWLLFVYLGLKAARDKGRSLHWMWFGLHPAGALFAYIALRFLASSKAQLEFRRSLGEGRAQCTECGEIAHAEVQRPFLSLGFGRFDCPACGQISRQPLTTGLLVTYWVMTTMAVVGPIIMYTQEGRIAVPGLLFLLVGVAVVRDLQLRQKRRMVEHRRLEAVAGATTE